MALFSRLLAWLSEWEYQADTATRNGADRLVGHDCCFKLVVSGCLARDFVISRAQTSSFRQSVGFINYSLYGLRQLLPSKSALFCPKFLVPWDFFLKEEMLNNRS